MANIIAFKCLVAASAAGLCFATPGYAQTSSDAAGASTARKETTTQLEEIIVTARRVEERAQDVPISIQTFTQQDLANNNVTNAIDLANITPSLSVNNNFGNENASFAIRGFVQDSGTAPSVGTYFGDVVAPRGPTQGTQAGDSVGPGTFFDLQNVQVLKGPQGTLFGRNTTGGAVLLVPQKPTANSEAYAEVSKGNYDLTRWQGAVNAPLSDDARFRVAVDHESREGFLHNISGIGPSDYNNINYTAVRASLVLDLSQTVENYTIASYSNSNTNGSVQKLIAANGAAPTDPLLGPFSAAQLSHEAQLGAGFYDIEAAVPDPTSQVQQWQVINTTTWHATDSLQIKNIASYAQYKDFQRSPLFATNWQVSELSPAGQFVYGTAGIPAVFTGVFPAPGLNTANQSTYTEELQFQGSALNQGLTYQAGLYFEWSDPLGVVGNQSPQLIPCTDLATLNCTDVLGADFAALGAPGPVGVVNRTVGETTYRDQGIYGQASYRLTDQLKLTGGVRYTKDKQDNSATRTTYIFPAANTPVGFCTDPLQSPSCSQTLEEKSSKPTWMLDLDYKPIDSTMLYAKYARGYRAGGILTNAPSDHRVFNPEKVDNFEVGSKSEFGGALPGRVNVAAFYNNFTDQQLQIGFNAAKNSGVSPTTAILNAGKSRIYGAELEVAVSPVNGLMFDLNYTYLNAAVQSIAPITETDVRFIPAATNVPSGTPLVLSPKSKATLSAKYTLPLDKSIGAIFLGATFVYTDKFQTNWNYLNPATVAAVGADYGTLPSHELLNMDLGWTSILGSNFDLTAFGTNMLNKQYYQFIPGLGSSQSALEFATVGEPRMFGVRLKYHFGG